jgi:hypothetical protein
MSAPVSRNDRDAVINVLSRLPADASLEDIRYEFAIIFDILKDMRDCGDEETIPHEVVMAELRAHIEALRADQPTIQLAPPT